MTMAKLKIRKNDTVQVIAGKDKGKRGVVLQAMPAESKLLVQGVNLVKKHQKPSPTSEGGIISKELPIHISNVALIDPKSDKPARVGFRILEDGTKVRVAKGSGEEIGSAA